MSAKQSSRRRAAKKIIDGIVIAIDSREKKPYFFKPGKFGVKSSVVTKLDTGDYQVEGRPDLIIIERKKNIDELCLNLGKERKRFERELKRMQSCKHKFIIIEDTFASIEFPKYSKMHRNSIYSTIAVYQVRYGVHFIFADNRRKALRVTRELLVRAVKEENA